MRRLEQRDVAFILGHKNTSTVCEWENGLCMPTVQSLFYLSVIYRTNPFELYYQLREDIVASVSLKELELFAEKEKCEKCESSKSA
jgi:hypothetical protein